MNQTVAASLDRLAARLGPKGFTRDATDMTPWLRDWRGVYHGTALAMLSPATVTEVQDIVAIANQAQIPVVPQGGNSGMVAGATPDSSGTSLLLSLRRLNRIRRIDPANRVAVAEAGVILENLHGEAAHHNWRFPLTLGGKGSATVGGLIATNAGGTQVLRHGTMRQLVAGLEVVLPSGELLSLLTPLKKDNRGPDLKQLFIGAEGTLGIITAATLSLRPALVERHILWLAVERPATALTVLDLARDHLGDNIEGFEIMPEEAVTASTEMLGLRPPLEASSPWQLLVEFGSERDDAQLADRSIAFAENLIERELVRDAAVAQNTAQGEAFWRIRESISSAMRAKGPALQHDISIAPGRMATFIEEDVPALLTALPGATAMAFGHLGDGNVHLHINPPRNTADLGQAWIEDHGPTASRRVYEAVIAAGGSISAEHGIGMAKRALMAALDDPVRLATLRAIKHAIDPAGIMNPGKLV